VARPAAGRSPVVAPEGLSATEINRAAELQAQLLAADRPQAVPAAAARSVERVSSAETGPSIQRRPGGSGRLAVEAAEEYRYVARDVRRIARVGGSMFVILAATYVALLAAGVAGH